MSTLLISACVREDSRTRTLAEYIQNKLNTNMTVLDLAAEQDLRPLDTASLALRNVLSQQEQWGHPMFRYARQFAEADEILIAAPYWDLGFPALLKIWLEQITVCGITFRYTENGIPQGLCRGKHLFYVTTAGGPIYADFGFSYVKTLAEAFYDIGETVCFKAENLDIRGADVSAILSETKAQIDRYFG